MTQLIDNINVTSEQVLLTPAALKQAYPLSEIARENVLSYRRQIEAIIQGQDQRKLIITGPCSIHDVAAAKEYAMLLKPLHDKFADRLLIVMRVYFEKPRTTVGWKGFINDPDLDDSFNVEKGLSQARELLLWLAELGLPTATEMLDPVTPQYLADLFAWGAVGARTTESQTHREMASGLSMPIGFKNGTDGSLAVAINALLSASSPHRFLGINQQGQVTLLTTKGNANAHIILRGGKSPNYQSKAVADAKEQVLAAGIEPRFIVDCSHGNSAKDFRNQAQVFADVMSQIKQGDSSLLGMMLESHLHQGKQAITDSLDYGVSITDACIDWQTTANLLQQAHEQLNG